MNAFFSSRSQSQFITEELTEARTEAESPQRRDLHKKHSESRHPLLGLDLKSIEEFKMMTRECYGTACIPPTTHPPQSTRHERRNKERWAM
jgi:hypothetical protein